VDRTRGELSKPGRASARPASSASMAAIRAWIGADRGTGPGQGQAGGQLAPGGLQFDGRQRGHVVLTHRS